MLIHIGYHKTASTWFQRVYCRTHPHLAVPLRNTALGRLIIHPYPFDYQHGKVRAKVDKAVGPCLEEGLVPVLSAERFSGSPYSGGFDSRVVANRLQGLYSDARVWVVIRRQPEAITSIYKHYVGRDNGVATVERWLRPGQPHNMPTFDFRYYDYADLIRYYMKIFGRDQVHVSLYEDLVADPKAVMGRLCDHLGVPEAEVDFDRRLNTSYSDAAVRVLRHTNLFRAMPGTGQFPIRETRGHGQVRRLTRWADERGLTDRWEGSLLARVREQIGDRYRKPNQKLALLLDEDLGARGYDL